MDALPDGDAAAGRLAAVWPSAAGAPPEPEVAPAEERLVQRIAAEPAAPCRVLLVAGPEPRVVVAADHAVVDGLGLVAVLAAVVGTHVRSVARGVSRPVGARRASLGHVGRRAWEALTRPPLRVAAPRPPGRPGEVLARLDLAAGAAATAELVAAAAGATIRWNAQAGVRAGGPLVVAVGASAVPGPEATIRDQSAWFRLRVERPEAEAVRRALRDAVPEPPPPRALAGRAAGLAARALARRTGSTFLVSNLGRLEAPPQVGAVAFWPWAHGRSGLSIGCATTAAATVLTLRARRADLSDEDAGRFLRMVADGLA